MDSEDQKLFDVLNQRLIEKGVKEKLRIVLREQLIKSGWRDSIKAECRKIVQEQGLDNINVDEMIKQVTPFARSTVPDEVKQDLLQRIQEMCEEELNTLMS